ncbi:MAG TPA: SCP2 sterol-binding domain-containing protein [Methylophilaceae bacterium]|nr:SCP2 sterol-binding domain-containing protein [Methylophilaceae bacterium]
MFKPLITRLLNHLISQNSWAKQHLQPHGGKSVCIHVPPVRTVLTILEDGGLAPAGDSFSAQAVNADATLTIPLSAIPRFMLNDQNASTLVGMEGDTELATALAKVLHNMSWEYEEDLSKIIGDAPAYEIAKFGRKVVSEAKRQTVNVAEMFSEYWQEEQPLIAKKRHVEQFINEVDLLRDDVERLEKRLEKLFALASAKAGKSLADKNSNTSN